MAFKTVSKLKKGEKIFVPVFSPFGTYASWAKIKSIDKNPIYNTALLTNKFRILTLVTYEVLSGKWKGKEVPHYLDSEWMVIVPDRPGKLRRILNILFEKKGKVKDE